MWSYSCLAVYEIIHNSCKELQHTPEITHNFICDISCGGFWSRLTWCMWTDQRPVGAVQGADPHGQSGEIPRLGSHRGCNHWLGSGMVTVARWSRRVSLGLQKAEISGVADELPFSPGNTSFDTCATQLKMPARFSHSSTKKCAFLLQIAIQISSRKGHHPTACSAAASKVSPFSHLYWILMHRNNKLSFVFFHVFFIALQTSHVT